MKKSIKNKMAKKKQTKKDKERKKYGHIAVEEESKGKFEVLRCKLIGEKQKEVTQDELLKLLLDSYTKR